MVERSCNQRSCNQGLQHVRGALLILCMVPFLCSTKETTSVTKQTQQYLNNKDYVTFENVPKTLANANISVKYLCTRPCTVHMDVVASSEFRTGIVVFKKSWKNEKHVHELRSRLVDLMLPSVMVYRSDDMQHSTDVYYTALRAWVVHNDHIPRDYTHNETIFYAAAKTFKVMETSPPHQRPYKDHQICKSWYSEHRWRRKEKSISACPFETDVSTLLSSPLASSHEYSSLIKKFQPFNNIDLEKRRRQLVKHYPMFTFSIWMYLLDYCKSKECGIIHHVDSNRMYTTPLIFLTPTGQIHAQMQLTNEIDVAILSHFILPLHQWVRLDVTVHGRMIILRTSLGRELESYESQTYSADEEIHFDDTDGFMALGGSKFVASIDGFFGPVKYYRLKALQMDEISNPLPEDEVYRQIQDYYSRCFNVKDIVRLYVNMQKEEHMKETKSQAKNSYMDLHLKYRDRPTCKLVPWTQEDERKHSNLFYRLSSAEKTSLDFWKDPVPAFGKKIFEGVIKNLSDGFQHLNSSIPDLMDSSCCGYHKASYLLAIVYEIGLGVPADPAQALLYSLIGAQGDDRLALMNLGYKHLQGIDTHSLDLDLALAYYMNVAKKTPKDRLARHTEQAFAETIRLMDGDILKEQTRENDDLFLWLKQNAERGDPYAQHRIAQMLFWGQQGVTQDTRAAIEWYERGALENEEPVLMYDYAVLLFKGDGVPKNKRLALELMKKSASKGQVEALNGLGWYYHNFKKDNVKAVKYWSKAYDKGNADAAFNLGVMHLHGISPESGANETRAFEYMSKASDGGHIEASINVAQYLIMGSLRNAQRNPKAAVFLAKFVAEQNGNVGLVIRKAVNAYLDGSLNEALLHFILAAEAGIESSQTNVAYLCEELPALSSFLLRDTCVLRYYNLSVHQPAPSTYALLKMGDMYYYGGENHHRHLEESVKMYTQAAALGDAQGFFNLAQLIQEGVTIPEYMLKHLKLNASFFGDNRTLVIELYERCQNHSSDEGVNPCTLVLLYLQVNDAWNILLLSPMMYLLVSLVLAVFTVQCIYAVQDLILNSRRVNGLRNRPLLEENSYTMANASEPNDRTNLENPHSEIRNIGLHR